MREWCDQDEVLVLFDVTVLWVLPAMVALVLGAVLAISVVIL